MISSVVPLLAVLCQLIAVASKCPCQIHSTYDDTMLRVCVKNYKISNLNHESGAIVQIQNEANAEVYSNCTVTIDVSSSSVSQWRTGRSLCPNNCAPPFSIPIPAAILSAFETQEGLEELKDVELLCSLTVGMVLSATKSAAILNPSRTSSASLLQRVVLEMAHRRIQECTEHPSSSLQLVPQFVNDIYDNRRKVKAVVMWVGAFSNFKAIYQQSLVLSDQPQDGPDAIIAWAATDQLYSCKPEEIKCYHARNRNKLVPNSNINFMMPGWGCAQRRQLRALGHVLKLFDPTFLLMLDDDSFLNYPLLMERYGTLIMERMQREPIVLGENTGKTGPQGHVSTGGLFCGGAGYILGQEVLNRLISKEVYSVGHESWPGKDILSTAEQRTILNHAADQFRSEDHLIYLSLLSEGAELAAEHCPALASTQTVDGATTSIFGRSSHKTTLGTATTNSDVSTNGNSCVYSLKRRLPTGRNAANLARNDRYQVVPIAVRLVDFCTNVWASPNTCLHRYNYSKRKTSGKFVMESVTTIVSYVCL